MFLVALAGLVILAAKVLPALLAGDIASVPFVLFPVVWVIVSMAIATISAWRLGKFWLIPLAPLGIVYLLGIYLIWFLFGLPALLSGREPVRDKPTRYANVVA